MELEMHMTFKNRQKLAVKLWLKEENDLRTNDL